MNYTPTLYRLHVMTGCDSLTDIVLADIANTPSPGFPPPKVQPVMAPDGTPAGGHWIELQWSMEAQNEDLYIQLVTAFLRSWEDTFDVENADHIDAMFGTCDGSGEEVYVHGFMKWEVIDRTHCSFDEAMEAA